MTNLTQPEKMRILRRQRETLGLKQRCKPMTDQDYKAFEEWYEGTESAAIELSRKNRGEG